MKNISLILFGVVFIGLSHVTLRGMSLKEAAEKGDVAGVSIILKNINKCEKKKQLDEALRYASYGGYIKIAKLLIESGANVNEGLCYGCTSLIYAADKGRFEVVKYFLNNGAIVKKKYIEKISKNRGKESIVTLLSFAHEALVLAKKGEFEKTKAILQKINCYGAKDGDGLSYVFHAVLHKDLTFLKFLVNNGAKLNTKDNDGMTPLCHAAKNGSFGIARYLIENGADVNANVLKYVNSRLSPLLYAVSNNNVDIACLLVRSGAVVTSFDIERAEKNKKLQEFLQKHTVFYAIKNGGFEKFRKIIDGLNIDLNDLKNDDNQTILHVAVIEGKINIVRYVLQKGVDANKHVWFRKNGVSDGSTPLHYACTVGDLAIVKLLLKKGAEINKRGNNGALPIYYAAMAGFFDIVTLLVSKGSLVGDKDISIAKNEKIKQFLEKVKTGSVFDLVKQGDLKKLQEFFSKNSCDINVEDKSHRSLLHIAVKHKKYGIMKFLLEKGINIEAKDYKDETPLCYAISLGDRISVEYLVKNKANVSYFIKDSRSDYSPLGIAFAYNNFVLANFLLQKGANIDICDSYNGSITPLHTACMNGELEQVRFLVQMGAEINRKCRNCKTAIVYAEESGHMEIVRFLLNNGAKIKSAYLSHCDRFERLEKLGYKPECFFVDYNSKERKESRAQALWFLFGRMITRIINTSDYTQSKFYRFFQRVLAFKHKNKDCILREIEDALGVQKDIFKFNSFIMSIVCVLKQISVQKNPYFVHAGLALKKMISLLKESEKEIIDFKGNSNEKKTFFQELLKKEVYKCKKKEKMLLHVFAKKYPEHMVQLIACYSKEKLVKDINAYDEKGKTPLIVLLDPFPTSLIEDLEVAIYAMVKAGADINKLSKDKRTCPLLNACSCRADVVPFLLQLGANPNVKECRCRPLRLTVARNKYEATKALLQKGATPNFKTDKSPLCWSIENKNHKMTKLLLENKADPNDGQSLFQALEAHNVPGAGLLLAYGADPIGVDKSNISKEHGINAVDFINKYATKIQSIVMDNHAKWSSEARAIMALILYAANKKLQITPYNYKHKRTRITNKLYSYNVFADDIKRIIKKGYDLNQPTEVTKLSPLHYAVIYQSVGAVKALVKYGADCKRKCLFGLSAEKMNDQMYKAFGNFNYWKNKALEIKKIFNTNKKKRKITTIYDKSISSGNPEDGIVTKRRNY